MVQLGFRTCKADDCLFNLKTGADEVWLLLYVDDIIVLGSSQKIVESAKRQCSTHVEIKDLGVVRQFLGVSVQFSNNCAWLSQEHFTRQILIRFEMDKCNAAPTPMVHTTAQYGVGSTKPFDRMRYQELLGALLFLSTHTRPDIVLAVGILCRHSSPPTEGHWTALKRVMRYLKGHPLSPCCYSVLKRRNWLDTVMPTGLGRFYREGLPLVHCCSCEVVSSIEGL